jgi:hypothetical protein
MSRHLDRRQLLELRDLCQRLVAGARADADAVEEQTRVEAIR